MTTIPASRPVQPTLPAPRPTAPRRASRGGASPVASRRGALARFDADQADLQRAEALLARARAEQESDPRSAFELTHRAALRGAGVLVTRANRERRRKLPLNVWTALDRLGGPARERAEQIPELVRERDRLDRDPAARPDPELLRRHLHDTSAHLARVREEILSDLPAAMVALSG